VRDIVGYPSELSYVNVAESHFECLDGRIRSGVLGTPGGDAGEFILALHVYEDMVGEKRKLTQEAVDSFLKNYVRTMRQAHFFMCTDDQALDHLSKEINAEGINIQRPRTQIQPEMLEALTTPENNGCSHLKMLLRHPELYQIKPNIVKMFV